MKSRRQTRLDRLTDALKTDKSLHLKEAANLLGVSEMTVRRDIADSNGEFTYLGGHIVSRNSPVSSLDYFLDREECTNIDGKTEACRNAFSLIEDRDVIFLDCGTTLPYLAENLPGDMSLTVICYSVNIAEIVCKKPNIKVILLGGEYHPSSASFASDESLNMLSQLGINKAFISAGGLHFQNGLSCSNFFEVRIKRVAMSRAVSAILVMDSSKFGQVKAASFAALEELDAVCTDGAIKAEDEQALSEAGIPLHR